ncbi:MAG: hypothetical protein KDB82_03640 [Planctomycetes bacterium]|nr:hypothetical protein [Planctomycetota bacterium]
MEDLYRRRMISENDVERAYSGAFILFYSQFETAFENLFLGLVSGRLASQQPAVKSLVKVKSDAVLRRATLGGRSYFDWFPFGAEAKRRVRGFLSRGKPFTDVTKADRSFMEEVTTLRNAIAHSSHHARKRFKDVFVEGVHLLPRQRRPAGYLRGNHMPGQSRLEFMMLQSLAVTRRLAY